MIMLYWFFCQLRWVLLPVACSTLTVLFTVGVLGAVGRPATVVSSNFISLLAIITISLIIHLIVRYREIHELDPSIQQHELILETVKSKFPSCFYTALTTIVAFGSLLFSGIRPVMDFGWMMAIGGIGWVGTSLSGSIPTW